MKMAKLIILPETAFPIFLHQLEPDYVDAIAKHAADRQSDLLFGVAIADPQARAYFNAVVSMGLFAIVLAQLAWTAWVG